MTKNVSLPALNIPEAKVVEYTEQTFESTESSNQLAPQGDPKVNHTKDQPDLGPHTLATRNTVFKNPSLSPKKPSKQTHLVVTKSVGKLGQVSYPIQPE